MKSLYSAILFCLSLSVSTAVFAESQALQNCKNAWKQSSAFASCVGSDTAITASGNHCNIEAVCYDRCTWKKLADMNGITVEQTKGLQNCDGQLATSSQQCKVDNEEGCYGDTN